MTRREKILNVAGVPDDVVIPAGYLERMVRVVNNVEQSVDGEWVDGLQDEEAIEKWLGNQWPMQDDRGVPSVMNKVEATVTIALMSAVVETGAKIGGPETARGDLRVCWQKMLDHVTAQVRRSAECKDE